MVAQATLVSLSEVCPRSFYRNAEADEEAVRVVDVGVENLQNSPTCFDHAAAPLQVEPRLIGAREVVSTFVLNRDTQFGVAEIGMERPCSRRHRTIHFRLLEAGKNDSNSQRAFRRRIDRRAE